VAGTEPKGTNPSARPGNKAFPCCCEHQTRQGYISSTMPTCNVSADPILQMFSSKRTRLCEYFSNYQAVMIEMSKKKKKREREREPLLNRMRNWLFGPELILILPVGST
jgi:hypothetical protein